MSRRAKLIAATAALTFTQVAHLLDVFRYDESATIAGVLTDPLALLGISIAGIALIAVVVGSNNAPGIATFAAAAVAAGFLLYHGIPFDLAVNNPYWGDSTADFIQCATVIAAITAGASTCWLAPRTAQRAGPKRVRTDTGRDRSPCV